MSDNMSDPIATLGKSLTDWGQKAVSAGWLSDSQMPEIPPEDLHSPAQLFTQAERPLVVAFFGGTGVGKSSLLNRLAKEAVATASAVRPTSMEITLYFHHEITLGNLPPELPTDKISKATHSNDVYRNVLWIDMPDFDSVETSNHTLVNDWMPHIDMLVYVVSPERYRDDTGWRLLLKNAQRHAWAFVINHWDRGNEEQRNGFRQQLQSAGLQDPLIFCTDCSQNEDKPNGDEFNEFATSILKFADKQIIRKLEQHGVLVRIQQAFTRLEQTVQPLQSARDIAQIAGTWQTGWDNSKTTLANSMEWKFRKFAEPFGALDKSLLTRLLDAFRRDKQDDYKVPTLPEQELVDQSFVDTFNSGIDKGVQSLVAHGIPLDAAKQTLHPLSVSVAGPATDAIRQATEQSLAQPGTPLQRRICQLLRMLRILLPAVVLSWALYQLIYRFVNASTADGYLGFSFATHTLMLAGCAWFIPWLLHHHLRPTHKQAALRGMQQGLDQFLDDTAVKAVKQFDKLEQQRQSLLESASGIGQVLPESIQKVIDNTVSPDASGQTGRTGAQLLAEDPTMSRVLIPGQRDDPAN